jgi:CrcB protein
VISYALVALGSAIGGVARHWCGSLVAGPAPGAFPWATLFVNVTGSFLIGVLAVVLDSNERWAREFLMVGVLGGYTTFSAFSLQTLELLRDGKVTHAGANVAMSVLACLLAVWLGHVAARALRP